MDAVKNSILVIAAHPDDEVLGCGGAIAWHKDKGDAVHIRIFAEGITSRLVKETKNYLACINARKKWERF